jgi:ATP-dependent Clp protease ATP-binding subunit ClpB
MAHEEGGKLTEAVRRKPYSILLFDEIEKAHADIFNILLQVMDEGRLTDRQGRIVDFRNTIIIMTSNMGSSLIQEAFSSAALANNGVVSEQTVERTRTDVIELLKQQLKPEFLNRIDEIVMFDPLSESDIRTIVDMQMGAIRKILAHNGISLNYTDAARDWIARTGYDAMFGARPVKRVIQREVVNELSKKILAGDINREKPISIDVAEGGLTFSN